MKIKNHLSNVAFIVGIFAILSLAACTSKPGTNQEESQTDKEFSLLSFTDIGTNTLPGSKKIENETLTLLAGGADIWGVSDEFRFAFKKQNGDFDVEVQIESLSKANTYTKAGIMARADLDENSAHAYFQIFPDNSPRNKNNGGCEFQYRLLKGGEMKAIYPNQETAGNKFDVTFPETWVRLKRQGNTFESYLKNTRQKWELYSTFEMNLPSEVFLGIALTSHDSNTMTEAQFSSLKFN